MILTILIFPNDVRSITRSLHPDFNEGIYFDNYYTRLLTGSCGDCGFGSGGIRRPEVEGDKATARPSKLKGCTVHTKKYPFKAVTHRELSLASAVLARFDVVLIMELFYHADLNLWLRFRLSQLLFGGDGDRGREVLEGLQLGRSRVNFNFKGGSGGPGPGPGAGTGTGTGGRSKGATTSHEDAPPTHRLKPPPAILKALYKENAFDKALYDHARADLERNLKRFVNN